MGKLVDGMTKREAQLELEETMLKAAMYRSILHRTNLKLMAVLKGWYPNSTDHDQRIKKVHELAKACGAAIGQELVGAEGRAMKYIKDMRRALEEKRVDVAADLMLKIDAEYGVE